MKGIGKMICKMAEALKHGQKEHLMKVTTICQKNKAQENTSGLMVRFMKDNGMIIKSMDLVLMSGKMVESFLANGKTMTCMALEFIFTLMESGMMVNTRKIKRKAMAFIIGLMAANMRAGGVRANSMVSEYILMSQRKPQNMDYGKTGGV